MINYFWFLLGWQKIGGYWYERTHYGWVKRYKVIERDKNA